MFTGIVEEVGKVISVRSGGVAVAAGGIMPGMKAGDSMAVNGVCLTLKDLDASSFSVDIMPETLRRTNLGILQAGDGVNLERPLALADRLGGHLVQGHIDDTGRVVSVVQEGGATLIKVEASPEIIGYVVEKGFIAVDGVSLTVVHRDSSSFLVSVVGYTQQNTTLGVRRVGDVVNLEIDIIAKYVEQLVKPRPSGMTVEFLKEHGYAAG